MKKARISILLISLAFLLAALFGGTIWALDRSIPLASPIPLPAEENVASIIYGHQSDLSHSLEPADYEALLQLLSDATPTRKMTVNDQPYIQPYYTIFISTSQREYRYYIYQENGQIYAEVPYVGIYETSQQLFDWIVS